MKGVWISATVAAWMLVAPVGAEPLPIRIDASKAGVVYVQKVDSQEGFVKLADTTPATLQVEPGERVDIRVVADDGWLYRYQGNRQNVAGPANVTIRLERSLAWDHIALLGAGAFFSALALVFGLRRKAKVESEVAKSQIISLEERVASAEKVGALAKTLGDYLVLDRLGAGAMGVVYKVKNAAGEVYAAKVPNEMDARVVREAEVSATLISPYIVRCYGLVEGEPNFLLLEYLEGCTVHDWLEEHRRPALSEVDLMIQQLLSAVEVAHQAGVYHRDLKPENMFLAKVGGGERVLKVMDFGLASSVHAARLTRTGEAMGTPIYASPEQLSGNPVDATTDLYSIGVFIFEITTGLLPWSQTDPVALTLAKYKPLPKEPIEHRKDLPMAWNQLVVDLLNGDPSKRPRSVEDLKRRWAEGIKSIL